jgi:hypothetical protein
MKRALVTTVVVIAVLATGGCRGAGNSDTIAVPMLGCAVEGSPLAGTRKPGEITPLLSTGSKTIFVAADAARQLWKELAHIAFHWDLVGRGNQSGIPVIADPLPPAGRGWLGDLDASDHYEPVLAAESCVEAWEELDPSAEGIVIVNARKFENAGLTAGVAVATPSSSGSTDHIHWLGAEETTFVEARATLHLVS